MRILILSQYFPPETGAPPLRAGALAVNLARLGHEVEVVTGMPNYPTGRVFLEYRGKGFAEELRDGIRVRRCWIYPATGSGFRRMVSFSSFLATALVGLFRARRPDLLIVSSPPMFLALHGFLMARRWRIPWVFDVRDLWPDALHHYGAVAEGLSLRVARRLEKWTYRRADHVTAISEDMRSTLLNRKGVPPQKALYMPNGIDAKVFRPLPYDSQLARSLGVTDAPVVLYAGNHGTGAGLDVLLEAAALLADREVQFILVGDGTRKEELEKSARDQGLRNVVFRGVVQPEEVPSYYSIADVAVASTLDLPRFLGVRTAKMVAAMACGKPLVYSGNGEGPRVVAQVGAGIATDPGDAEALAAAVIRILDDPAMAAEMGARGRRHVEEHLDWPIIVREWLEQIGG